jgi:membrane protein DedA with SNARE-associated domain
LTEQLVAHLGYVGIALILILGGLGLPIPEEAPVILAAVLSRNARMFAPLAFTTCLVGVLVGDFIVYFLGYFYGEKVLSLPVTRRLLTRAREAQIKGYFHRHGFKILVLGRFAVGFRTAAYLTAGILKLPPLKLFLTDLFAATLSTSLMFGLGYIFANQIQSGIKEVQQWFTVGLAASVSLWLLYRYYEGRRRAGLPVGPPVLYGEEPPLPPDDLKACPEEQTGEIDSLLEMKPPSSSSLVASRLRAGGPSSSGIRPLPVPPAVPTATRAAAAEDAPIGNGQAKAADVATGSFDPAPRPPRGALGGMPRAGAIAASARDARPRVDDQQKPG